MLYEKNFFLKSKLQILFNIHIHFLKLKTIVTNGKIIEKIYCTDHIQYNHV